VPHSVAPGSALFIGFVGGAMCIWLAEKLRSLRLDDPVDAIAVHGWGGVWGLLAAGIFYAGGMFDALVFVQVLGVVVSFLWAFPISYVFFKLVDKLMGLRAPTLHEQRGLDYTEHHEWPTPSSRIHPGQMLKAGKLMASANHTLRRRAAWAVLAPVMDENSLIEALWLQHDSMRGESVSDIIGYVDAVATRHMLDAATRKRLYSAYFEALRQRRGQPAHRSSALDAAGPAFSRQRHRLRPRVICYRRRRPEHQSAGQRSLR